MMTIVLQYGRSPLYRASYDGHHQVVKTLIEAGANTNKANQVSALKSFLSMLYFYTPIQIHMYDPNGCVGATPGLADRLVINGSRIRDVVEPEGK